MIPVSQTSKRGLALRFEAPLLLSMGAIDRNNAMTHRGHVEYAIHCDGVSLDVPDTIIRVIHPGLFEPGDVVAMDFFEGGKACGAMTAV